MRRKAADHHQSSGGVVTNILSWINTKSLLIMKLRIIVVLLILTSSKALFTSRLRSSINGFLEGILNRLGNPISANFARLDSNDNSICGPFKYMDLILKACRRNCFTNQDCRNDEICSVEHNKCINPCSFDPCEFGKPCYVCNHKTYCNRDSIAKYCDNSEDCCDHFKCYTDEECIESEQCVDNKCIAICKILVCDSNKICKASNHRGSCYNRVQPFSTAAELYHIWHRCTDSSQCGENRICHLHQCHPHPCKDHSCYKKETKTCESSPTDPLQCKCLKGQKPGDDWHCYECTNSSQCGENRICHLHQCHPHPCKDHSCYKKEIKTCESSTTDPPQCKCLKDHKWSAGWHCYECTNSSQCGENRICHLHQCHPHPCKDHSCYKKEIKTCESSTTDPPQCKCLKDHKWSAGWHCYECTNSSQCGENRICHLYQCHPHPCKDHSCYKKEIKTCESSPTDPLQCKCLKDHKWSDDWHCYECTNSSQCGENRICHLHQCHPHPCKDHSCYKKEIKTCESSTTDPPQCKCLKDHKWSAGWHCYECTNSSQCGENRICHLHQCHPHPCKDHSCYKKENKTCESSTTDPPQCKCLKDHKWSAGWHCYECTNSSQCGENRICHLHQCHPHPCKDHSCYKKENKTCESSTTDPPQCKCLKDHKWSAGWHCYECTTSNQCGENRICHLHQCHPHPCKDHSCYKKENKTCESSTTDPPQCKCLKDHKWSDDWHCYECTNSSQCGENRICHLHQCHPHPCKDHSCYKKENKTCESSTTDPPQCKCLKDHKWSAGWHCYECTTSNQCGENRICHLHQCHPHPCKDHSCYKKENKTCESSTTDPPQCKCLKDHKWSAGWHCYECTNSSQCGENRICHLYQCHPHPCKDHSCYKKEIKTCESSTTDPLQCQCLKDHKWSDDWHCYECTNSSQCGENRICHLHQCHPHPCKDHSCYKKEIKTCESSTTDPLQCQCLKDHKWSAGWHCYECTNSSQCGENRICHLYQCHPHPCKDHSCYKKEIKTCESSTTDPLQCQCLKDHKWSDDWHCYECTNSSQCGENRICHLHQCHPHPCKDHSCYKKENKTCESSTTDPPQCKCLKDHKWSAGWHCYECTTSNQCGENRICHLHQCHPHPCKDHSCYKKENKTCESSTTDPPQCKCLKDHKWSDDWHCYECTNSSQCGENRICHLHQCHPHPCKDHSCYKKENKTCESSTTDPPQCKCLKDHKWSDDWHCYECTNSSQCGENRICHLHQCHPHPCKDHSCYKKENKTCESSTTDPPQCKCLKDHKWSAGWHCYECTNSSQCGENRICHLHQCHPHPCKDHSCYKQENKTCESSTTDPPQCKCLKDHKWSDDWHCYECTNSSQCGENRICHLHQCHPHPCKDHSCYKKENKTCESSTTDPPQCKCLEGHKWSVGWHCYECTTSNQCGENRICHLHQCHPHPCKDHSCYKQENKTCESSPTDPPQCVCKDGYSGTPSDACYTARPCTNDDNCPYNEKCNKEDKDTAICMDACKCLNCGYKSCKMVSEHTAQCHCEAGFADIGTKCVLAAQHAEFLQKVHCKPLTKLSKGLYCSDNSVCDGTSICCNNMCKDVCKARECNNGKQCFYSGRDGYCDCPHNHFENQDGICQLLEASKRCPNSQYYDKDFGRCRQQCSNSDECYADEICRRLRCEYLCSSVAVEETCTTKNHLVTFVARNCKHANGKDCGCATGSYMSADRAICHLECNNSNDCRNGKTCTTKKCV